MFMVDKNYQIRQRTSQFFAAQLMTQEWAEQGDAEHQLFRAESDIKDADGHTLVTAYALKRPDSQWSLLLINKDFDHAHPFRLKFHDESVGVDRFLAGPVTTITFGKAGGEPHSHFIARPGQFYYAPVTLQLTPGFGKMYSLQFNLAVTTVRRVLSPSPQAVAFNFAVQAGGCTVVQSTGQPVPP